MIRSIISDAIRVWIQQTTLADPLGGFRREALSRVMWVCSVLLCLQSVILSSADTSPLSEYHLNVSNPTQSLGCLMLIVQSAAEPQRKSFFMSTAEINRELPLYIDVLFHLLTTIGNDCLSSHCTSLVHGQNKIIPYYYIDNH